MSISSDYVVFGAKDNSNIPKQGLGVTIFNRLKERNPHDVINIDASTESVLTCQMLLKCSIQAAMFFNKFGLKQGDVVTILSENCINYFAPILGAFYLGIVINTLNPEYSTEELKHALRLTKPKLVICSKKSLDTFLKIKADIKFVEAVVLINGDSKDHSEVLCLENELNSAYSGENNFSPKELDASNLALILMSSGTTGMPKGVMLTHSNMRMALVRLSDPNYSGHSFEDITVTVAPFFHVYGFLHQFGGIYCGIKMVVMTKFKPEVYLKCVQQYRATVLHVVPTLLHFLAINDLPLKFDLSSVKYIWHGGAPTSMGIYKAINKRYPQILIREGYSLTESNGIGTLQYGTKIKPGSIGTPMIEVQAKIWDSKTKQNLPPLHTGELCLRGPMVMKGYIGYTNADVIDEDGFLHTGDLAYFDDESYFYIVGRIKELIKYKGFQVSPTELERLLMTHPDIKDCGVIGIPDEIAGQLPFAYVVLQIGAKISEQDVVDYVAERISPQKRLYGGVQFISEIAKSPSGKILRKSLMQAYLKQKSKN